MNPINYSFASQHHRKPAPPPGFVMLLVLVILLATMVTAVGLSSVARRAGNVAAFEEGGSIADSLARAGITRASAYAYQVSDANNGDFDKVLDPQLEADCATSLGGGNPFSFGQLTNANDILRPMFTDASADVEFPAGSDIWWRPVADSGGAYLVRFEDDEDDSVGGPEFDAVTANNAPGPEFCYEGLNDTSTSPEGYSGASNPVRDRNRSIWVISLGIFPGTDPAAARYRSTRRSMLVDTSAATGGGAAFNGNEVEVKDSGATISLISDEAPAAADEFENDGTFEGCRMESDNFVGGNAYADAEIATPGVCGSNGYAETTGPAPATPLAGLHQRYMDFTSSCNFFTRNYGGGGDPEGIWYWDASGIRIFSGVPANCNDRTNFPTGIPRPDTGPAAQVTTALGSCWIPLAVSPDSDGTAYDPCDLNETWDDATAGGNLPTSPGGPSAIWWRPNNTLTTIANASTDCNGYFSSTLPLLSEIQKPAWNAVCGGGVIFPPNIGSPVPVTPTGPSFPWECSACDGSAWALQWSASGTDDDQIRFPTITPGTQPMPRGLYILDGDWVTSRSNVGGVSQLTPPVTGFDGFYPPITLLVTGRMILNGNAKFAFGTAGQPPASTPDAQHAYPSLIVLGNFEQHDTSALHLAGGFVYANSSGTNYTIHDTAFMRVYGTWVSDGGAHIHVEDNATLEWRYMNQMFAGGGPAVVAGNGVRMSFPLRN